MKKIVLVLIAILGISFAANAQSCDVGDDTYVAIAVTKKGKNVQCIGKYYGSNVPESGTAYVTVYYINTNGEEDSEMITCTWNEHYSSGELLYVSATDKTQVIGKGQSGNVDRIKSWEVSAGACRVVNKE